MPQFLGITVSGHMMSEIVNLDTALCTELSEQSFLPMTGTIYVDRLLDHFSSPTNAYLGMGLLSHILLCLALTKNMCV